MDELSSNFVDGIITLQVGHYSNFIGTHWWNIQHATRKQQASRDKESQIKHEIFLREEFSRREGATTTPRLLCIDLKGSLKSLKQDGNFSDSANSKQTDENRSKHDEASDTVGFSLDSPNQISVHYTDPIERHDSLASKSLAGDLTNNQQNNSGDIDNYFNLDDVVEVWSDFLGNEYNQNSVLLVEDYWHSGDSRTFSSFGQGYSTGSNENFWESWEDKMHFFVEECDSLQGFQVLTDLADGFGGLTTKMLHHIQDCFGSKAIAVYGSWPGIPDKHIDESIQVINSALALSHITQNCSFFTPLSLQKNYYGKEWSPRQFPHLLYKANSHYHTSAIIASLLDTVSLQYRLEQASFGYFCNNLIRTGHKIAASSLSLPLPLNSNSLKKLFKDSSLYGNGLLCCLTPSHTSGFSTLYSNQVVLRGVPNYCKEYDLKNRASLGLTSNKNTFEAFVYEKHEALVTGTTFCTEPLKTPSYYPQYFSPMIDTCGFLQSSAGKDPQTNECPVLSGLFTSSGMFDLLYEMLLSVKRVKKSKLVLMEQTGLEQDEFEENMESLAQMAYLYDEKRAIDLL